VDDIMRQALRRAHRRISEGRWTQSPLFDGHGYCLLGSVGENPRAVDEIAKVLRFRRFKRLRIAIWNDSVGGAGEPTSRWCCETHWMVEPPAERPAPRSTILISVDRRGYCWT
jgi:hypothetical protein